MVFCFQLISVAIVVNIDVIGHDSSVRATLQRCFCFSIWFRTRLLAVISHTSLRSSRKAKSGDWPGFDFVWALFREVYLHSVECSKRQLKGVRKRVWGFRIFGLPAVSTRNKFAGDDGGDKVTVYMWRKIPMITIREIASVVYVTQDITVGHAQFNRLQDVIFKNQHISK